MQEPTGNLDISKYHHGFAISNRLGRLLWKVVQHTVFRCTPAGLHFWRRWLLRRFGANIHPTALVYPTVNIWAPWNLTMEADATLSWGVDCYCVAPITLRRQAIVSQHARLISASHDITSPKFPLIHAPIEIGTNAWVCAYAYVGMGLKIGEGAVVAATATATKDVDRWTIVGGNPARVIGHRQIIPH